MIRVDDSPKFQNLMTMHRQQTSKIPVVLVLFLFFVSGALALVYELVWSRLMMHVFGSTALAVGTVLAAFMFGMAVGAWRIGRVADRSPNCLRLYAWLEIGIALAALISHILLSRLGPAHLAIHDLVGASPGLFALVRFLLAFLLVLAPTVLMGATLPVLTRFLLHRQTLVGINLSTLYSVNTFGAVSGVLVTGFFLIGRYGIHAPVYIAVTGNLLIGCIAWIASMRVPDSQPASPPAIQVSDDGPVGQETAPGTATVRIVLFGLGLSGFTSFAYEIYWTRSLVFILGNSTYALTAMLSAFLTGIALGGYLIRFLLKRSHDRAVIFGWIQVFLGVFSALALPLLFSISDPQSLGQYLIKTSAQAIPLIFAGFGVAFLVMLVPATLIGATFPLVGQIAAKDPRETATSVGRIYAINTFGNVLGALLPGFVLLGWLGIQKGILVMAVLNVALGFVILFLRLARPPRHPLWRLALPLALVLSVVLMGRAPLQFQFPSDGEQDDFETLFYREGPLATTKVYVNPRSGEKHMSVDGIVIGGTGFAEFKQLLLAHLPKLLLDDVSNELSVGVGSGILLGESALHPRVREITGVEIEPSVIAGAGWFVEENHEVLENPRLKIVIDDIGSFLRTSSDSYQVISADEKTADEYASNGFSYSRDYYQLLREHLAPGGLVAQWVPTTLPSRQYRMVLKTFTESFPHVQLWYFLPARKRGPFNSILIGSGEPIPIKLDHIRRRFAENPEAFKGLAPYGLTSAEALLPHFVADEKVLRAALEQVPVNSLDHPRYEFFHPWDYARERESQFIANHEMVIGFKRQANTDFLADLGANAQDSARLRQTMAAEFRYLAGFQKFLEGITLAEQYRIFDDALAVAPWNDSLRARIFAQYSYIASTRTDPAERARMTQRANALYGDN
jgi:spermidine synthase